MKYFSYFLLYLVLLLPALVFADNHNPGGTTAITNTGETPGGTTPGPSGRTPPDSGELTNVLPSEINSIEGFFLAILDILLVFAIPFVVFFVIYAGFLYVTAQGNPDKISQANRALMYALIGGLLILGARGILVIVEQLVTDVSAI